MSTLTFMRVSAVAAGSAAALVGCYAAYEFAAKADGGYLMVGAPIVAAIAALIPVYFDVAFSHRQWIRGTVLFLIWLPCAATVFYTAAERVHLARAGAEAERQSLRLAADRATTELTEAKAAKDAATAAANRIRGLDSKACKPITCQSVKATEEAAIKRLANAETALKAAEAKAVTESGIKQWDGLLPLALDGAGIILIATGFRLGRHQAPPAPAPAEQAPTEAPAKKKDPKRVAAGIKAGRKAKLNKAIKDGTVTVLKRK